MSNLLELQRQVILSGKIKEDDLIAFEKDNVILTFTKTGSVAESEYNGKPVLSISAEINCPGTWICQLKPLKGSYQARPVKRLDAAFFMALKESQKKEIASILWAENHDCLLTYFKEKYEEEVQERIANAVSESNASLQVEIDLLRSENDSLSQDLNRCKHLLSSQSVSQVPVATEPEGEVQLNTVLEIKRISGDQIYCKLFTDTQYYVHISLDKKTMFIQPHRSGKALCIENTLYLTNFSNVVPFEGETTLMSEYVPGKGFYVYFD